MSVESDDGFDEIGLEAITVFVMALAIAIRHLDRKFPDDDIAGLIDRYLTIVRIDAESDFRAVGGEALLSEVRCLKSFLRSTLDRPEIEGPPVGLR